MTSRYAQLSHAELTALLPELLLSGFIIDQPGMPWCTRALSREGIEQIAIEEWILAARFMPSGSNRRSTLRAMTSSPYGEFVVNYCGSPLNRPRSIAGTRIASVV
ncbi:hypothetical protein MUNTM_38870 [Mycobacterium sp. MUNTM1]